MAKKSPLLEDKKQLRAHFIRIRDELNGPVRSQKNRQLTDVLIGCLLDLPVPPSTVGPPTVTLYMALRTEADLSACIAPLRVAGWRVAVPITETASKQLRFAAVTPKTEWRRGAMGILEPDLSQTMENPYVEPSSVTVFCVPGVAFTRTGLRLGYGGGYYDRLFARPDVTGTRIGIAFDCQVTAALPSEAHDVRMHYLATEKGVEEITVARFTDHDQGGQS